MRHDTIRDGCKLKKVISEQRPPLIPLSQLSLGTLAGRLIRSQLPERNGTHFGRPRLIPATWQYFNDPLVQENRFALCRRLRHRHPAIKSDKIDEAFA